MKVLIIEDEFHAAKRLKELVLDIRPEYEIIGVLDSISSCVKWFGENESPGLIFQDIQLGDGLSFEIFKYREVNVPIVFTTAFDEYAIRAFKTNSIDYLLKPIDPADLESAIQKFEKLNAKTHPQLDLNVLQSILSSLPKNQYVDRLVTKSGSNLHIIKETDFGLFFSEQSISFLITPQGQRHMLNQTMDQLQQQLNPSRFFRINMANILSVDVIKRVSPYFNNRLAVETNIPRQETLYVSRERVKEFKLWIGDQS